MKIQKIEVKNFKAVNEQIIDFNGCSAMVTAGNRKGKSSALRGLIDRFQGEKPNIIVKKGEEKGFSFMELTDGSRIEWNFTEKTERFSFTTKEGIKMTSGVLSQIGEKYFGKRFDVDKFIVASGKVQSETLANLVGLDFSEINQHYKVAYEERTEANRELKRLQAIRLTTPTEVEEPNSSDLKAELLDANKNNEALLFEYEKSEQAAIKQLEEENKKGYAEINAFNVEQRKAYEVRSKLKTLYSNLERAVNEFNDNSNNAIAESVLDTAENYLGSTQEPKQEKVFEPKTRVPAEKPAIIDTLLIHEKIEAEGKKQRDYDHYERELKEYNNWINEGKAAAKLAIAKDEALKQIEAKKRELIEAANMPSGFSFGETGVMYNELPYENNQISSSEKYIAALKLGAMALGEVKALHFDASFLDRNSLSDVQEWAEKEGLQLLIERPDFDGGEIKYEVI